MNDVPVGGDYNGDATTDIAVYGPGSNGNRFAILPSGGGSAYAQDFGSSNSIGLPPDAVLFSLPATPPATSGTAAQVARGPAGNDLFDLALSSLSDDLTGRRRPTQG